MWMPFKSKDKSVVLPTAESSTKCQVASEQFIEKRKDSGAATAPLKNLTPARKPSARIREPIREAPSQMTQESNTQRSTSAQSTPSATRPGLQRRRTTARTRYVDMLLGLDAVSPVHNILASLFVWILLAGYIVFPATFTKLQDEKVDADVDANSDIKSTALKTVRNVSLLYVAAFACGIGVLGCLWLWWKHRKNYIWVINRIFLPALLNSLAGLISTIVNVYSAQDGQYSVTAKVTIVVSSACSVVAAGLFLMYNTVMLKLVKKKHEKEFQAAEREEQRCIREERVTV